MKRVLYDQLQVYSSGRLMIVAWIFASLIFSCGSPAADTSHDDEGEWIVLFDGGNLDQWRTLGSDSVFTAFWKIEDGILKKIDRGKVPERSDGQPLQGGDLMTKDAYENYELSWEWALFEEGNSGLKYNVSEEMSMQSGSKHSALGFEYQMLDDTAEKYEDLNEDQFTGSLYDLIPAGPTTVRPLGEFNSSRIIVDGDHVEHWLNGERVVEYSFDSEVLKEAYERSKFSKIPGFADKRNGHIVLQDHITEAWFRNIKIRIL